MAAIGKKYITLSLTADTPDELSVMTVVAQSNWSMEFEFFDFSQLKNGMFICWYRVPLSAWQERQSVNGQT